MSSKNKLYLAQLYSDDFNVTAAGLLPEPLNKFVFTAEDDSSASQKLLQNCHNRNYHGESITHYTITRIYRVK